MADLHFTLGHLEDIDTLEVHIHGKKYPINSHTEISFQNACENHPVLSRIPISNRDQFKHFATVEDSDLEGDGSRWVQVVRPVKPGDMLQEVVLMSQVIPPSTLRAHYRSNRWKNRHHLCHGRHVSAKFKKEASLIPIHYHGRLHHLNVPALADEEKAIEIMLAAQELVDTMTTAVGFVAHHPELATIHKSTSGYIRDQHILPNPSVDPDQYNAMQALEKAISESPSWSPVVDSTDHEGNPIKAGYDIGDEGEEPVIKAGDTMQTFGVADDVLIASLPSIAGAKRSSSADMQLQNNLWKPSPGKSVAKSSNVSSDLRKDTIIDEAALTQFKWTVPYQTYTNGIKLNASSIVTNNGNFSIDSLNIFNRTLTVAYELFDDDGNSMGPRKPLGNLSAVDNIMGVPIPVIPTKQAFPMGEASTLKIYFGSLGRTNWDTVEWGELNVTSRGTLYTIAWQYAIPMVFFIAGKAITKTAAFNKIVSDPELFQKALFILVSLLGPVVGIGAGVASNFMDSNRVLLKLANIGISFATTAGLEKLGKYLIEQVLASQLKNAFGPIGWILRIVSMGTSFAQMAITTGEVLSSDALTTAEIKRAIDVKLNLLPDPDHGEAGNESTAVWPSVATTFVAILQPRKGTNLEIRGLMPKTTSNTSIPITFIDVPAGGDFRITFGVYSANGWLAGSWKNTWTKALPNIGTSLDLGDKKIKENLVPLGIDTQYQYKEEITYKNSDYKWSAKTRPPSTTMHQNKQLTELSNITVNNSAFQVGYIWQAINQNLSPDRADAPPSNEKLYSIRNLSILADPSSRLKKSKIGLTQKPGIAYSMFNKYKGKKEDVPQAQRTIDQTNFIIDPRNGKMNLRQVMLGEKTGDDFELTNADLLSWGSFPMDNLDAMVIHPSNAVIACSFSNHKLLILDLPENPMPDDKAPQARIISGKGIREGLMQGPKALTISPDGRILVLESINNRVQAFDVKGNAVSCFTPDPFIFTLNKTDITKSLDGQKVPSLFLDTLVNNGENFLAALPNNSFIEQLDSGTFGGVSDPLVIVLADSFGINLAFDVDNKEDKDLNASINVITKGESWIISDPRKRSWQILAQSGDLNVYQRPVEPNVEVQNPGSKWLLEDPRIGLNWLLKVSEGDPNLIEVFDSFTYYPLNSGPKGSTLNYLDMAVEGQGYMYILSYMNDGYETQDYLLDVYEPDGTFLFRSPDATKTDNPQNIVAGKITVDVFRDLYALTYATPDGISGNSEPGIAHWMPTPPLFDLPLSEQSNLNNNNISAIQDAFKKASKGNLILGDAKINTINRDDYWELKEGLKIYHVYRTSNRLQVYTIPA